VTFFWKSNRKKILEAEVSFIIIIIIIIIVIIIIIIIIIYR